MHCRSNGETRLISEPKKYLLFGFAPASSRILATSTCRFLRASRSGSSHNVVLRRYRGSSLSLGFIACSRVIATGHAIYYSFSIPSIRFHSLPFASIRFYSLLASRHFHPVRVFPFHFHLISDPSPRSLLTTLRASTTSEPPCFLISIRNRSYKRVYSQV